MKFRVRVSELRYGDVIVDAENEEAPKKTAEKADVDWFDSEVTDMTVEKAPENG